MIHRRKFMGSMAALCAASGSLGHASQILLPAAGRPTTDRPIDWRCDVIRTWPHDHGSRPPVVTGVSIQPAGNQLAVVGDDHHVCIYDSVEKKFVHNLQEHTDWVRTTKYSPDGKLLATAGNDRKLRIWATDRFQDRPSLHPHLNAVICIDFTSDSTRLATVGFGPELRIYDLQSNRIESRLQCECPDNHAVAFSADDRLVAAGGRSGWIRIWDTKNGELIKQIRPHQQRVRSLEFMLDNRIVSCGDDQLVKISSITENVEPISLPRHAAKLYDVAILGQDLLATSGTDNLIHVWRMTDTQKIGTLNGHRGTVSCLDVSQEKMASGGYDTEVRVWHIQANFDPAIRQTKLTDGWNNRSLK